MKSTIRKCEKCYYQTFILKDDLNTKKCKRYGGLMKIIKEEEKA